MNNRALRSNLWKLGGLAILLEALFVIPVITIFWLSNGLDMTQVFITQAAFAATIILLEVPSGYFADKYGRKRSLIIGSAATFIPFTAYFWAHGFWQFIALEVATGIGVSFLSGANSAMLYDTLTELKREKEYRKFEARYFSLNGYIQAAAAIFGAWLAAELIQQFGDMRGIFLLQGGVMFFMVPLALALKEPKVHAYENPEVPQKMKQILIYTLHKHKEVKWTVFYAALMYCSTLVMVWYTQPFWKSLGVPLALFGTIWAAMAVARSFFAHFAQKYEDWLGKKNAFIALMLFPVVGYVLMTLLVSSLWALIFLLLFQLTYGIGTPVIRDYINRLVPSHIRATVLSIQSLMVRAVFIVVGPFLGWVLDVWSFQAAFLTSAALFFTAGAICLFFLAKSGGFKKVEGKV